jgi:hypothetical protein
MGHATANDLIEHLVRAVGDLPFGKLVQISMDGPNVNLSFWTKFNDIIMAEHSKKLLNIGTCGLHVLHNSFKLGAESSKWELTHFLRSLFILFDDVPARREDYLSVTNAVEGAGLFPQKWCSHRWLENASVAQRAFDLLPALRCYLKVVCGVKPAIPKPGTKSFEFVNKACQDVLLEAKLACFISIAKLVEPFLTQYQTDKVMCPFLCEDLENLLKRILRRFRKVDSDATAFQLLSVDLNDTKEQLDWRKIDAGFVAENLVKTLLHSKKISEREAMAFRLEAKDFMKSIVFKLLEKSPIRYKLVRCLVS